MRARTAAQQTVHYISSLPSPILFSLHTDKHIYVHYTTPYGRQVGNLGRFPDAPVGEIPKAGNPRSRGVGRYRNLRISDGRTLSPPAMKHCLY